MSDVVELELVVGTREESEISVVEEGLDGIDVERWKDARFVDPVTIFGIAASVAKLISALMELKERLAAHPNAPSVEMKTADGRSIKLTDATPEMLKVLLEAE
jgi:hypothetical protein